LWYLIIYPFTWFTADPEVLKLVQGFFATIILALVWFRSPFTLVEKILISSSYHIMFVYGVLARSYVVGVVICFAFASYRRTLEKHPPMAWVLLGLLSNVHVYLAILSAALGVLWLAQPGKGHPVRLLTRGLSIYLILLSVAAVSVLRPGTIDGSGFPWSLRYVPGRLTEKCATFCDAFITLDSFGDWSYWGPTLPPTSGFYLGLCLALVIAAYLWKEKLALTIYAAFVGAAIAFFYVRYGGATWHSGLFYIALVTVVWYLRDKERPLGHPALFLILLLLNAGGGVKATVGTKVEPLTSGRQTVEWIKEQGLDQEFWVGHPAPQAVSLGAYLDRPLYLLEMESRTRYVRWNYRSRLGDKNLSAPLVKVCDRNDKTVLYLAVSGRLDNQDDRGPENLGRFFEVTELARFDESVMEKFTLYRLLRKLPASRGALRGPILRPQQGPPKP
jgi:hypothetical protein